MHEESLQMAMPKQSTSSVTDGTQQKIQRNGRGRTRQQMSWTVILKSSFVLFSFATGVLLARVLGAAEYGIYSYVFALVTLLATPSQLGLPQLVMRETARAMAIEDYGIIQGIWRWSGQYIFLTSILFAFLAVAWLWLQSDLGHDSNLYTTIWAIILVPLVALGNLRGQALRGLQLIIAGQLPEFILRPGIFLLFLLTALLTHRSLTASSAMLLHVIAATLAFGVGAWFLQQKTPAAVRNAEARYTPQTWFFSALPLALIAGMNNVRIDILLLGHLVPADQIGIYRVALQCSSLAAFGLQAVNIVVAPRFAALHTRQNSTELQRLVTRSSQITLLVAVIITVGFIFMGELFLRVIFGASYQAAYLPMMILLCGQLGNAAFGPVGFLLNMTGNEMKSFKGLGIAFAFGTVLNWILIPYYGIVGAAVATSVFLITWNVLLWWSAKQELGIHSHAFSKI